MKYQMTDRMRSVVNQSMDILGGAGICKGKANFMGNAYQQIPIGITVEGANILTRSLIVFGQGLNRSHPNLLPLIEAINKGDDMAGFNKHLALLIRHAATNGAGSVGAALRTFAGAPFASRRGPDAVVAYHEAQLSRLARAFAISADLSLVLGGKLKFAEMLSGRYAAAAPRGGPEAGRCHRPQTPAARPDPRRVRGPGPLFAALRTCWATSTAATRCCTTTRATSAQRASRCAQRSRHAGAAAERRQAKRSRRSSPTPPFPRCSTTR